MKYLKTYNESIKKFLKPKSDDDILKNLKNLSPQGILRKSIDFNFLSGFKYLCDNNLVDEIIKYIIEKYKLNQHQDEQKDYESWFLKQLTDLTVYSIKDYDDYLIYKKGDDILFNYDQKHYDLYYNFKIYSNFKSNFKLNDQQISLLVSGMVEKHLKIRVGESFSQSNLLK